MPAVNLHRVHGLGNTIFPRPSFRELAEDFSYDVDSIIGEHARPSETIPHLAQELLKSILKSSEDSPEGSHPVPVVCLSCDIGGSILKQAFLNASLSDNPRHQKLCNLTTLVFFGTPHRETASNPWETTLLGLVTRLRNLRGPEAWLPACLLELSRYHRKLCRNFRAVSGKFKIIQYRFLDLPQLVSTIGSDNEEVIGQEHPFDSGQVLSRRTHLNHFADSLKDAKMVASSSYQFFQNLLRGHASLSYSRATTEAAFLHTAEYIFSAGQPMSWLQSQASTCLSLGLPANLADRRVFDSLLTYIAGLRNGSFRKYTVISTNLGGSHPTRPTTTGILSDLIVQILQQSPSRFASIQHLYDETEMAQVLGSKFTYLLEPLLWRLLTALLAGYSETSIVCVLCFASARKESKVDRVSAFPDSPQGTVDEVSVPWAIKDLAARFCALSTLIDTNFKTLLVSDEAVAKSLSSFISASSLSADSASFDDRGMTSFKTDSIALLEPFGDVLPVGIANPYTTKFLDLLATVSFDSRISAVLARYIAIYGVNALYPLNNESPELKSLDYLLKSLLLKVPDPDRSRVCDSLRFVTHAVRPLTRSELSLVGAMASPDLSQQTDWIIFSHDIEQGFPAYLSALTYCNGQDVYLADPILEDILRDKSSKETSSDSWYHTGPHPHIEITRCCLNIIRKAAVDGTPSWRTVANGDGDINMQDDKSPGGDLGDSGSNLAWHAWESLLDYSVRHWIFHFHEAVRHGATEAERTDLESLLSDKVFQTWQRMWVSSRIPELRPKGELPILQQSPFSLANRVQLPLHKTLLVVEEALAALSIMHGNEIAAITWSLAVVAGSRVAVTFWEQEMPSDSANPYLLLPGFGQNPDLAFALLRALNHEFVQDNITQIVSHDLCGGGTSVLGYAKDALQHLVLPPANSCASLGLSRALKDILADPELRLVLTNYLQHQRDKLDNSSSEMAYECENSNLYLENTERQIRANTVLHIAIAAGDIETVKSLVMLAGVDVSGSEKFTSVSIAARFGFHGVLEHLPRISNPNRLDADGKTPLFHASEHGYLHVAEQLLKDGATPFEDLYSYRSALNVAVTSNQAQILKLFLDLDKEEIASNGSATKMRENHDGSGCDTEAEAHNNDHFHSRDCEMRDGLLLAAERGFSAIALLMVQNMDVIDQVDDRDNTVLHLTAKGGTHEVLKTVLESRKVHIDVTNDDSRTALQEAAQNGFADCVSELLTHGADHLARVGSFTLCAIELAVMSNHKEVVEALLKKKHDKKALGEALERAALDGRTDLVTLLLDEGADVDYVDDAGDTSLNLAAYFGEERVVEILLRRRAALELKDDDGRTALAAATIQQKVGVMKLLLDAGADLNAKDKDNMTPLDLAINEANEQEAALLMSRGAKIKTHSLLAMVQQSNEWAVKYLLQSKNTEFIQDSGLNLSAALNRAIQDHNLDMISLLLDHEADPEDTNVLDLQDPVLAIGSPIHFVAFHCMHEIAELLLTHEKRKVNVNLARGKYWTALEASISGDSQPEDQLKMFKFLVGKGGDPTIRGGSYGNLLNCAVATASASILEGIIAVCDERGLTVKDSDIEGRFPSHFAATGANQRIFKSVLLPDLGAKDKQDRVPIHFAAGAGSLPALEFLLRHSIDLRQVDKDGWNPLHWACRQRDLDVVDLILEAGARFFVNEKTVDGYTAEDIAILHNNSRFIPLLRSYNVDVGYANSDELSRLAEKAWERSAEDCVSCRCVIYGRSHHCTTCADIDLCFKCYRHVKDIHDPTHTFESQGGACAGSLRPGEMV